MADDWSKKLNSGVEKLTGVLFNDRLLFWAAIAVAFTVTALQEIPEKFRGGHAIGVVVAAVAYAYVGAWIFNWVIVRRPRAKQLREIYRLVWPALSFVAMDGDFLVRDLIFIADPDLRVKPADANIRELTEKINANAPPPHTMGNKAVDLIRQRIENRNAQLASVSSLLSLVEHEVLLRLAEVNACGLIAYPLVNYWEHLGLEPAMARHYQTGSYIEEPIPLTVLVGNRVAEYYAATENLRRCMETLRLRPGPVGPGIDYTAVLRGSWNATQQRAGQARQREAAETAKAFQVADQPEVVYEPEVEDAPPQPSSTDG
ncbi:hypothetical protein A5676_02440 [Mycobacterium malmoense]|uniref:hypothetical protein n=1 Tax=Mycobacterium malmoense TaxID=1780 RepID=UPI00080B30D7|nr:hypothetical protein [Mycobacterium malmoense]OCB34278.1 hypothetical protein A5676_02440 [Mycobacterium malmoense]